MFPYIGLAVELKARGHTPVVATAGIYREPSSAKGSSTRTWGRTSIATDTTLYERVMHPTRGGEVIVRELLLPKLAETYEQLRGVAAGADLLVTHPITYAGPIVGEREGLPWVSTVLAPMLFFSAADLPVFPQAPAFVHVRKLGVWAARLMVGLARNSTQRLGGARRTASAPTSVCRAAGIRCSRGMFSPHLTLALFSRVLGLPQPDWPQNVETTGFVFYNGPDALDPKLEAFLAAGPPPVVFTLGTSAVGAAGRFYHESAAAAARLGVRAVLLTGGFAQNMPAGRRRPTCCSSIARRTSCCSRARARSSTRAAWARRDRRCAAGTR